MRTIFLFALAAATGLSACTSAPTNEQEGADVLEALETDGNSSSSLEEKPHGAEKVEKSSHDASGPVAEGEYRVQQGDTLMKVAFEVYGDLYQWKRVYEDNKEVISNPMVLTPGTVLKVAKGGEAQSMERNGDPYLIKSGDTLGTISSDVYGIKTKWRRLYENNRTMIKDPNLIFAGFTLYYTMTDEDRQEKENYLKNPQQLSKSSAPEQGAGGPLAQASN